MATADLRSEVRQRLWIGSCSAICAYLGLLDSPTVVAIESIARQVTLSIPANTPLDAALLEFSRQTGLQIVFAADSVEHKSTGAELSGTLEAREALCALLENSGLSFAAAGNTVSIAAPAVLMRTAATASPNTGAVPALAANRTAERNSSGETGSGEPAEVVVTAQKRQERLFDTPQSVSVVSTGALSKLGVTQFRDFADTVPGLNFSTLGAGYTQISLRGVTTGNDISSTVGIYVDDVPYGSSSGFTGSRLTLDVGLFDMDRVEVLRGPQGTLYGASTMGGLIKYVTTPPDTTHFGVDVQTGLASTHDGGASYNGSFAVNVPIVADKAALRASSFYSHDGGYSDNVALGRDDVNRSSVYGGRADFFVAPSEALSIRITGFLQNISRDGEGTADYRLTGVPLTGSLDQRRVFPEPFDQHFRLGSATVSYDFGAAALTSISSYQTTQTHHAFDLTPLYVPILAAVLKRSYSVVGEPFEVTTDKFTQEIRLASNRAQTLEWLIGGFYTHETSERAFQFVLRDAVGQPAPNDLLSVSTPSTLEEYSAFGDLTWHIADKFDVSGGVRYARNDQKFTQNASGILIRSSPTRSSSEDVFTYLANARYRFADNAMAYVRYATGYRPGGPNYVANDPTTGRPIASEVFGADRLKSYEIGFRAESSSRRYGIDLATYYIDWSDIQITAARGGFSVIANAPGGATIRGAELSLTARSTTGFSVGSAFAYQDAAMAEADPDLRAAKGERLPNVPRFTGAFTADYQLPLSGARSSVGATVRYVSERHASFDQNVSFPQYRLPSYTTVDLRAGSTIGSIEAQLYVHNLLDERGQLSAYTPFGTARTAITQPRTFGVSLTTHF